MCGLESDIVDVFDFHHLDENKDHELNELLGGASWEVIKSELDNCIVLCCDCHILWHYFQGNRNTANWTEAEENKLKNIWSSLTKEELELIFPERTWKSIYKRIKKLCPNETIRIPSEKTEKKDTSETKMEFVLAAESPETHTVRCAADVHN
jgi:hypothetical protein